MLAWIHFGEAFWPWSPFTFWTVIVSVVLTLGFTVVVFFGGLADLRFLLRALSEERTDETDDGRAKQPAADANRPSPDSTVD